MYAIYANIWGILMVNATIYSIHGSYGNDIMSVGIEDIICPETGAIAEHPIMGSSHGTPFLGANEILDIDTLWDWKSKMLCWRNLENLLFMDDLTISLFSGFSDFIHFWILIVS